jgi:SAM-dependent methyltransferase
MIDTWQIERLDPKHSPWYQKKLILEHITRYTFATKYCKDRVIVDLGCGSGYGSKILADKRVKKIYALDIDQEAINYAKKNYFHTNIKYICSAVENTRLPKRCADVVVCFETIEHLVNPEKLMTEIKRILKPSGILIISTPNKDTSFNDNPYHLNELDMKKLDILLSDFNHIQYYGQRAINKTLIHIYQNIYQYISISFLKQLFHFRPWENYTIHPLIKINNPAFLYLIAVCQLKNSQ